MDTDEVLLDIEERMEKCVEHLGGEYRGIKSGRASPGLVENLKVEYYGSPTPLKQMANIGAPEPALLVIKPFDPSSVGDIEKAILKSDIGITPQSDGKLIRLPIPSLSEEQRKKYVKLAKEKAEAQKVAIRNVRRDFNDKLKALEKDHKVSKDEEHKGHDQVQKITDKFVEEVDRITQEKEKDIMEV